MPRTAARARPRLPVPLEKTEEQWGDEFMALHGYVPIRISQTRATMQTCGIPDRKYFHLDWGHAVWWEAKRQKGARTSNAQFTFALLCKACGEEYVRGPFDTLRAYMEQRLPSLRKRNPTTTFARSRGAHAPGAA